MLWSSRDLWCAGAETAEQSRWRAASQATKQRLLRARFAKAGPPDGPARRGKTRRSERAKRALQGRTPEIRVQAPDRYGPPALRENIQAPEFPGESGAATQGRATARRKRKRESTSAVARRTGRPAS